MEDLYVVAIKRFNPIKKIIEWLYFDFEGEKHVQLFKLEYGERAVSLFSDGSYEDLGVNFFDDLNFKRGEFNESINKLSNLELPLTPDTRKALVLLIVGTSEAIRIPRVRQTIRKLVHKLDYESDSLCEEFDPFPPQVKSTEPKLSELSYFLMKRWVRCSIPIVFNHTHNYRCEQKKDKPLRKFTSKDKQYTKEIGFGSFDVFKIKEDQWPKFGLQDLREKATREYEQMSSDPQTKAVSDNVSHWSNVVIAYEPVWAIGTGKVASLAQAQEHGTSEEIKKIVSLLNAGHPDAVEVVVSPPYVFLPIVKSELRSEFQVGAQNCWVKKGGAFTGEISAEMMVNLEVPWVILGHSESRAFFGKSNEIVGEKVAYALSKGLKVIACVGETLEERKSGSTMNVVAAQIKAIADKVSDWSNIVIAYEPVWAIGTGNVASPAQAQEVHAMLRNWLHTNVSAEVAESTRVIYGGFVNGGNLKELGDETDVDGFLVGGTSLKEMQFHYGVFFAYVRLREHEIRNLMWISDDESEEMIDDVSKLKK